MSKAPSAKAPSSKRSGTLTASEKQTAAVAVQPAPALSIAEQFEQDPVGFLERATPKDLAAVPTNSLWRAYKVTKHRKIRNHFWELHQPLVKFIADRVSTRLPDEVDVNDLISVGSLGLNESIDAFDLKHEVKFETFCAQRIRGAILDELRNMDWVPRLVRSRSAKVATASDKFRMANGRMPTLEELAEILGLGGEEFDKVLRDGRAVGTSSLNRKCFQSDGNKDLTEIDTIRDDSQSDPMVESQRRDLKELITKGLTRAERLIVTLYYYEDMTMKEIGATLDLSESRVSQMHSLILQRLQAQMQHKVRELEAAE